jgi:hypothetical protein
MRWFTTHYDSVLEELYRAFRDSGEATFGNWFFQNGGFHHFVHFVYVYSVLSSKLFVLALVAAVGYMFLTKQLSRRTSPIKSMNTSLSSKRPHTSIESSRRSRAAVTRAGTATAR